MRSTVSTLALAFLAIAPLQPARAINAPVSVKAAVTSPVAEVGESLQFQLAVSGGESDDGPPDVKVDGLKVEYVTSSQTHSFLSINGRTTIESGVTYIYQVTPEREGDFTIPALSLKVGGNDYKTQPVALKVQKGAPEDKIGFAEISVAKKSAYVGELVPVEVKLLVRRGVRARIDERVPELGGDGFTIQRMQQPEQTQEERNGVTYSVVAFRTVISPSKAGKLTIGPSEIPFVAQIPRRPRSQLDELFGDDFMDPFGRGRFENKQFNAKATPVELEVKPLPTDKRPKDFSGAVGQFTFEAEGSPTKLKVGDPVTMRLRVSGNGNFDRITAPTMVDPTGWQAYDSSDRFDPADESKTSGTKTFELPVVAETPHRETPAFEFTFFDPKVARYITLRSKPQLLSIEGAPVAQPARAEPPKAASPEPSQLPKPATSAPTELAGLRYEQGTIGTFLPIYARPNFWVFQAIPAGALLLMIGARLARKDPRKRRSAELERQRDELWKRLRSNAGTDFWQNAARLVQLETARRSGAEVESVDAAAAKRSRSVDPEVASAIDEIFDRRDALLFAGAGAGRADASASEHSRGIQALEKFCQR